MKLDTETMGGQCRNAVHAKHQGMCSITKNPSGLDSECGPGSGPAPTLVWCKKICDEDESCDFINFDPCSTDKVLSKGCSRYSSTGELLSYMKK